MISANTRATRSRYSSPSQATGPGGLADAASRGSGPGGSANQGQKSFMQRWLEPPLSNRASFQDDGLMRHGVVENMAPLGTLPKAGVFKKAAAVAGSSGPTGAAEHTPIRRIIVKRPATTQNTPVAASTAATALTTATTTAASEVQQPETVLGKTTPVGARRTTTSSREDDEDEDWNPKAAASAHSSATKRSRRISSRHTASDRRASLPLSQHTKHPATPERDLKEREIKSSKMAKKTVKMPENIETIEAVIEIAVDEALTYFRYPTAWALRTLYDDNSSDPEVVSMFEAVFNQTADADTLRAFSRLIHEKKKEGKKDNKGCYYFVPPSTNSRFAPHKPKAAPFGNLITMDFEPDKILSAEGGHHTKKKHKSHHHRDSTRKMAGSKGGGRAGGPPTTPSKGRSSSFSSDSSLSSAVSMPSPGDDETEDEGELELTGQQMGGFEQPSSSRPAGGNSRAPEATTTTQPMGTRRKTTAAATKKNGTESASTPIPNSHFIDTPTKQNNHNNHLATDNSSNDKTTKVAADQQATVTVPAAADEGTPIFPNLSALPAKQPGKERPIIKLATKLGKLDEDDRIVRLRKQAKGVTDAATVGGLPLSSIRPPAHVEGADGRVTSAAAQARASKASAVAIPSASSPAIALNTRSTRASRKRSREPDDLASPTTLSLGPELAGGSNLNSRAGTPNPRAAKKGRTGLRVKNSPMKKKTGPYAGIPRASGERSSPAAFGFAHSQDENDDYCSSCGGNGELVCCDGCTRSFHFRCVDPPLPEGNLGAADDEFYCNICLSQRNPTPVHHSGPFGLLHNLVDKQNPRAFGLPEDVRNYFEGNKTGPDGEYEEAVTANKSKKKGGVEEVPDLYRVRDAEGNAILCHACNLSSDQTRPILPCSFCGLNWHMDCLDPPLAFPPPLRTWKCPCHVDDLLASVPGSLGPAHRFRKIKGAPVITPAYKRGNVNNGFIEVDDAEADEDLSGWKEVQSYGRLYKLPASGIKKDFISRIRHNLRLASNKAAATQQVNAEAQQPQTFTTFDQRSIQEQQVALNLATLASSSAPNGSALNTLVNVLVSEAPAGTLEAMALPSAANIQNGNLANADKQGLYAILSQLEQMAASIRQQLTSTQQDIVPATSGDIAEARDAIMNEVEMAPTVADPAATTPVTESAEEQNEVKRKTIAEARTIGAPSTPPPDERSEPEDVVMAAPANETESTKPEAGDISLAE